MTAGTTLVPTRHLLEPEHVCLVENATTATCAVAYCWSKMIRRSLRSSGIGGEKVDVVIYLDLAYKACIHVLKEYCQDATLVPISIPFLASDPEEILQSVEHQLINLVEKKNLRLRFAFLDHVSSQPSVLLPVARIVSLVREYGRDDMEICVDGAHAVGSVPGLDVTELDCDFYFSNLHKWGYAPPTATVLWSHKLPDMSHPIVSWAWGRGMAEESLFPGTRDFSAFLSVPAAVEYLLSWEMDGKNSEQYCHDNVIEAAAKLRRDWGVDDHVQPNGEMDESLVATQAMVRLPDGLVVSDASGQVSRGVRDVLREDYDIEASVGSFGPERGAFVRLSWAIYNTSGDIQRLSDGVLDIIQKQ